MLYHVNCMMKWYDENCIKRFRWGKCFVLIIEKIIILFWNIKWIVMYYYESM